MSVFRKDKGGPISTQSAAVKEMFSWLQENLDTIGYGEVGLVFTVHDGKVVGEEYIKRRKRRVPL
jgi:hypothetical protein